MKDRKILALIVLLALVAAIPVYGAAFKKFATLNAAGKTLPFVLESSGGPHSKHTIQVVVTGSPSTCTVRLEGTNLRQADSPADAQYANLSGDIDCTSTTPEDLVVHVANKPVLAVRANLTALTGGSSPTVTAYYTAVQ